MSDAPGKSKPGFNLLLLLPLAISLAIGGLAAASFLKSPEDRQSLPSAFAGRPAPALDLDPLDPAAGGPTSAMLTAPGVKLVNFWASWCAPCRVEHPLLTELATQGVPIIGVNYKDSPENAQDFLEELGDPFTHVGVDPAGRTGINWGLYGVPETFVIDGDGTVLLRHAGPITRDIYESRFAPLLEN